jgi:hypothetical protein
MEDPWDMVGGSLGGGDYEDCCCGHCKCRGARDGPAPKRGSGDGSKASKEAFDKKKNKRGASIRKQKLADDTLYAIGIFLSRTIDKTLQDMDRPFEMVFIMGTAVFVEVQLELLVRKIVDQSQTWSIRWWYTVITFLTLFSRVLINLLIQSVINLLSSWIGGLDGVETIVFPLIVLFIAVWIVAQTDHKWESAKEKKDP